MGGSVFVGFKECLLLSRYSVGVNIPLKMVSKETLIPFSVILQYIFQHCFSFGDLRSRLSISDSLFFVSSDVFSSLFIVLLATRSGFAAMFEFAGSVNIGGLSFCIVCSTFSGGSKLQININLAMIFYIIFSFGKYKSRPIIIIWEISDYVRILDMHPSCMQLPLE